MEQEMIELLKLVKDGAQAGIAQFPFLAEAYVRYRIVWLVSYICLITAFLVGALFYLRYFLGVMKRWKKEQDYWGNHEGFYVLSILGMMLVGLVWSISVPLSVNSIVHAKMSPATYLYDDLVRNPKRSCK